MLSRRASVVVAACSAGLGFYLGKRIHSQEDFYAFTALHAKSNLSHHGDIPGLPAPPPEKEQKPATTSVGQMVKYGFPSTDNLRSYEDFILSYDRRTRTANWVLEHLTQHKVTRVQGVERSKMKFVEDTSVHAFHRATNKDYHGSGYDRGHLAAAANHRHSVSAMNQTFILSNTAPQVGEGFNRNGWNNLEKYVRALARSNKNVFVCTGPLYLPRNEPDGKTYVKYQVIGQNNVAVPTHFFKVILIETETGQFDLLSFVMPNQPLPDIKLLTFLVPLEMIERAAVDEGNGSVVCTVDEEAENFVEPSGITVDLPMNVNMSGLIPSREHSIKLVEIHCAKYLQMFGECIHKYPHTWQMDCEQERRKLAKCAETNPEIVHIKSECAPQFHIYEKCMTDSSSNPEKCMESFKAFSSCADRALKTFVVQELSGSGAGASGSIKK